MLYTYFVQTVLITFSDYIRIPPILYAIGVSSPVRILNMLAVNGRPPCNMAVGRAASKYKINRYYVQFTIVNKFAKMHHASRIMRPPNEGIIHHRKTEAMHHPSCAKIRHASSITITV